MILSPVVFHILKVNISIVITADLPVSKSTKFLVTNGVRVFAHAKGVGYSYLFVRSWSSVEAVRVAPRLIFLLLCHSLSHVVDYLVLTTTGKTIFLPMAIRWVELWR